MSITNCRFAWFKHRSVCFTLHAYNCRCEWICVIHVHVLCFHLNSFSRLINRDSLNSSLENELKKATTTQQNTSLCLPRAFINLISFLNFFCELWVQKCFKERMNTMRLLVMLTVEVSTLQVFGWKSHICSFRQAQSLESSTPSDWRQTVIKWVLFVSVLLLVCIQLNSWNLIPLLEFIFVYYVFFRSRHLFTFLFFSFPNFIVENEPNCLQVSYSMLRSDYICFFFLKQKHNYDEYNDNDYVVQPKKEWFRRNVRFLVYARDNGFSAHSWVSNWTEQKKPNKLKTNTKCEAIWDALKRKQINWIIWMKFWNFVLIDIPSKSLWEEKWGWTENYRILHCFHSHLRLVSLAVYLVPSQSVRWNSIYLVIYIVSSTFQNKNTLLRIICYFFLGVYSHFRWRVARICSL